MQIPKHRQIPVSEGVATSAYGVIDPESGALMKSEPIQFRRGANDNENFKTVFGMSQQEFANKWNELIKKVEDDHRRSLIKPVPKEPE